MGYAFRTEQQQVAKDDRCRYLDIESDQVFDKDYRDEFVNCGGLFGMEEAVVAVNILEACWT